ncbi:hypothetical protein B0J17DRAFT_640271 [Rhizoctonia solani]|nr:hypothetical protein B0J17DRAFT_640271 [Rhizoctonia solani]
MASSRSTTGCFACKTKRKKCDETKPYCLRCQKSRIECPGYTYVQTPNKPNRAPRTLPASRTVAEKVEEPAIQLQTPLALGYDLAITEVPYGVPGSSMEEHVAAASGSIDVSNQCSLARTSRHSSINFHSSPSLAANAANPDSVKTSRNMRATIPMTPGQASLLEALFSLGQPPNRDLPLQRAQSSSNLLSESGIPLAPNWPPPDTEVYNSGTTHDDNDKEGVTSVIGRQFALDKTTESNALPFVLHGYIAWIRRLAFEPSKLTGIAQDFVFSQFEDGEQSRWIVVLLANIGSQIGSAELVEVTHNPMLCALQTAVRRRLVAVKALHNPQRVDLVKALDCAVEAMLIQFYASPLSEGNTLRREAAPIFRQLCPEPPGAPINLSSLLQHPLGCIRQYAQIEILFDLGPNKPSLFDYEVTLPGSRPLNSYSEVSASQGDGIVQWLHGIPNQILLLLANMNAIKQGGLVPNNEMIASLERDISELQPYNGSSSDRLLAVMRSVIQECWRQAAFVYLYMAVCGDPCNTPRVRKAFKRYTTLLHGTKPGRLPDEFLIANLMFIAPAAQQTRDRKTIIQRILGLYMRGRTLRANIKYTCILEDLWARVDAEGRPTTWSDVVISQRRVVGM